MIPNDREATLRRILADAGLAAEIQLAAPGFPYATFDYSASPQQALRSCTIQPGGPCLRFAVHGVIPYAASLPDLMWFNDLVIEWGFARLIDDPERRCVDVLAALPLVTELPSPLAVLSTLRHLTSSAIPLAAGKAPLLYVEPTGLKIGLDDVEQALGRLGWSNRLVSDGVVSIVAALTDAPPVALDLFIADGFLLVVRGSRWEPPHAITPKNLLALQRINADAGLGSVCIHAGNGRAISWVPLPLPWTGLSEPLLTAAIGEAVALVEALEVLE